MEDGTAVNSVNCQEPRKIGSGAGFPFAFWRFGSSERRKQAGAVGWMVLVGM